MRELALKLYIERKLSLSEAADISELSIGKFMEILAKKGIRQEMPKELLKEALNAIELEMK